jgi:MipA family protein
MRTHSLPLAALTLASLGASLTATRAAEAQEGSTWSGVVGVGVATMPRYAGSDESRVRPMPVLQLEYKGRVFLGGSQSGVGGGLGAYVVRGESFVWQVSVDGSEARPESRGDALAGMGKRSGATFGSTAVSYRLGFVSANAGVSVGLGDDQGSYGTLGVGARRQLASRWVGELSTGATIADDKHMRYEFGITSEQSATRRGLIAAGDPRLKGADGRAYSPGSGLKEMHASASLAYATTARTRVIAFARGSRLSDEAGRSPLVRERNGVTSGVAMAYGF